MMAMCSLDVFYTIFQVLNSLKLSKNSYLGVKCFYVELDSFTMCTRNVISFTCCQYMKLVSILLQ